MWRVRSRGKSPSIILVYIFHLGNPIERYVTWPGQAVGYKVGQIKILQLRQKAQERLGDKFDIKKFHDVVLECAGPLGILETKVQEYMDMDTDSTI